MRRWGAPAVLGVAMAGLWGCAAWDGAAAAAEQSVRQQAQARASEPNASHDTITVEFDVGDDVGKKTPDGRFLVQAFQVGFFDGDTLLGTVEVPRSRAKIDQTHVTLVVPRLSLARGGARSASLRVRGLSAAPLGAWSGPAGSVRLQAESTARASRRGRDRTDAGGSSPSRARRTVTLAQLNRHPALKDALARLDDNLDVQRVVSSFKRVQDLALAVVLARKHGVSLARICDEMQGDHAPTVTAALKALRPGFDVDREVDAALPEARTLAGRGPR